MLKIKKDQLTKKDISKKINSKIGLSKAYTNKITDNLINILKHPLVNYHHHDNDEMIPKVEKKYWELNEK